MRKETYTADEFWMQAALSEARIAAEKGEVPVGAVIVSQGRIVASAHNQKESSKDATQHAEMLAIRRASTFFAAWRLIDTTLYTTLEPCLMCSGAIYQARIARLVCATKDDKYGDFSYIHARQEKLLNHKIDFHSGICAVESKQLLEAFFQKLRP